MFHLVYYTSKTLDAAQTNHIVIEREILFIVYAFQNFRFYMVGSNGFFYTNHAAIRYLLNHKDAKTPLIRWILLFQGFVIEIKDRKGYNNQNTDHI